MLADRFKEYFNFSRKERTGIISLLLLILILWFLPAAFEGEELDIRKLEILEGDVAGFIQNADAVLPPAETADDPPEQEVVYRLFEFDPNTLEREGWLQLGLSAQTITTIENYTSRGGKFYKPEDFKKIFGLKKEEYDRLYPYIRIRKNAKPAKQVEAKQHAVQQPATIEINTADAADLIKLKGIGTVLSKRIVAYRQKLGGFYTVGQLNEVYGLPDSTFQHIRGQLSCDLSGIVKMNINTAHKDSLKAHPYVKYRLADAVIAYREQHGSFKALEELKQVHMVTDEIFEKIKPYLTVE